MVCRESRGSSASYAYGSGSSGRAGVCVRDKIWCASKLSNKKHGSRTGDTSLQPTSTILSAQPNSCGVADCGPVPRAATSAFVVEVGSPSRFAYTLLRV